MPIDVRVPVTGESVSEATVGAWLKHEGEHVAAGEPLVELETDKVNLEVSAERSGVLERIEQPEGATVRPGDLLATLTKSEEPAALAPPSPIGASERPHASPLARRVAEEHGIDLDKIEGSGTGGRVTREDVERYVERSAGDSRAASTEAFIAAAPDGASPSPPLAPPPAPARETLAPVQRPTVGGQRAEERVRLSRRRQTIAQRLVEAQHTAAILTTFNEVDMTAILELRKRRHEAFRARYGAGLGFMSFFTKAVVDALKTFPRLNAEIQGEEMVLKRYYDIGIAVASVEGLVVPLVRDADRKSFGEIEQEIADLAERARSNR
ncbi:MAG: 2-oxo acid dehydrogenase subunit E2, partial [Chloroflexi bacterium]|nr:2-oxo acid dehydrogenase subunit E2 [Chloroflexota bacterium]